MQITDINIFVDMLQLQAAPSAHTFSLFVLAALLLERTYPDLILSRWVDKGGITRGIFSSIVRNGM